MYFVPSFRLSNLGPEQRNRLSSVMYTCHSNAERRGRNVAIDTYVRVIRALCSLLRVASRCGYSSLSGWNYTK